MNNVPAGKSLWRHPDFVRYWSACAVDIAGSGVTAVALPLIAVVSLHATVWQVSLLNFAERLPPLLVTLPAGALADRHRKRPLMIGAVLVCGTAFTVIPLADAAGRLSLELLYAVALVTSAASLVGSTPRISYLPSLLPGEKLLEGNAKIGIRQAVCEPGMQGRMLATGQWITYGTRPLAALLAGAAGTWLGLWNTLALGTAALALPFLLLFASSIRSLHRLPGAPPAPCPSRPEGEPA